MLSPMQANADSGSGLTCNASGGLAFNGDPSPSYVCTDFVIFENGEVSRGEDNGIYTGHDEPILAFFSDRPGSANNVQWEFILPVEGNVPSFQNFITFWLSMVLCDNDSFPFNACIPNSDANVNPGSAFLELQFYPPGKPFFFGSGSCPDGQWCAAMTIDEFTNNNRCLEPIGFALIQQDGIPTGPPAPGKQTQATTTPNASTLTMNQGDRIRVTIHDTPGGVIALVEDLTTGISGFQVATSANGWAQVSPVDCSTTPFDYHPAWSTATQEHINPWGLARDNIAFAMEIGHFEQPDGDNDDDNECIPGLGCLGTDADFDGTSYSRDYPGSPGVRTTSIKIGSVKGGGIGPLSARPDSPADYDDPFPTIRFETTALPTANAHCPNGNDCKLPPDSAQFYPFFALITEDLDGHRKRKDRHHVKEDEACFMLFGDFNGTLVNNFDADLQYGSSDVTRFPLLLTSDPEPNPCLPDIKHDKEQEVAEK
jgi:hypothetical protein